MTADQLIKPALYSSIKPYTVSSQRIAYWVQGFHDYLALVGACLSSVGGTTIPRASQILWNHASQNAID